MDFIAYSLVLVFFSIMGAFLLVGRIRAIRYWCLSENLPYVFRTVALFTGVGALAGLGVLVYSLYPEPVFLSIPAVTVFVPIYLFAARELHLRPYLRNLMYSVYTVVIRPDSTEDASSQETAMGNSTNSKENGLYRFGYRALNVLASGLELSLAVLATFPILLVLYTGSEIFYLCWIAVPALFGLVQNNENVRHEQGSPSGKESESPTGSKNVLLYVIDAVRRDRTSLYGYSRNTTPFLNTIRDDSQVFTNFIAPGTRSGHSIPSLLTGVPASLHRYFDNLDSFRLVSDEFRENGYTTASLTGNPHMTTESYRDRFDWYTWSSRGRDFQLSIQRFVTRLLARLGLRHLPVDYFIMDTDWMGELGCRFIQERSDKNDPFFLYLHPQEVHESYVRDLADIDDFAAEHGERVRPGPWMREYDFDVRRSLWYSDRVKNWGYDEAIRNADRNLGRLYACLEEEGLLEETVIVVTSDHGELLGERGLWGHIDVPYNELVEIPFLIHDPAQDGREINSVVSGLSMPSLMLDAAGLQPTPEMELQLTESRTLSEVSDTTETPPALVDFCDPRINTKAYDIDALLSADVKEISQQWLLVGEKWKCHSVNGGLWYYRYEDSLLEDPVSRADVPSGIVSEFESYYDAVEALIESDTEASNFYDGITDSQVQRQLEDLGYM